MSRRSVRVHIKHAVDLAEPRFGVSGRPSQGQGDLFRMAQPGGQSVRGVLGDNAPAADDDDALADCGGFGENVSAQNHGMRSCQAFDQFPDLDDLFGVEADGRFV